MSTMRPVLCLVAALGAMVPSGAALATDTITVRVPVRLKSMMPEAKRVTVQCTLFSGTSSSGWGQERISEDITGGALDKTFNIVITKRQNASSDAPNRYICRMAIHGPSITTTPYQGTLPSAVPFLTARPDEYFRWEVRHAIGTGNAVDNMTEADGFAIPQQQKQ